MYKSSHKLPGIFACKRSDVCTTLALISNKPLLSNQPLLSGYLPFPQGWPLHSASTILIINLMYFGAGKRNGVGVFA